MESNNDVSLSLRLAEFVCSLSVQTVPVDVLDKARACLLNGLGMARGSMTTPYTSVACAALSESASLGEECCGATLLANGRRSSVIHAALANAALFHGRAQEDTCGAAHIGAIVIPLLAAMLEAEKWPIARLLPALIAAYEVGGLIEQAYSPITTAAGLRASPLYGTLAAAAAAAYLMGLNVRQTSAAIANAASFTGGLLQSFEDGTDEWRYQVGTAAIQGYIAASLARAGSVSSSHAFEGRFGFAVAFARTTCDVGTLAAKLGREWATHRVTFKPYPVCAFNQTPVIAALKLRESLSGRTIKAIEVRMNPFEAGYAGMDATGPFHSISGTLMSTPFCVSTTLLHGVPTYARMTDYEDKEVARLISRTTLVGDPDVDRLCCVIELQLDDGDVIRHRQTMAASDYAYDFDDVSRLVCRVGAETSVPEEAYSTIGAFAKDPESVGIARVVACFLPAQAKVEAQ
ncbi:MmgE/PrpD family protein [Cupriavidus nantongensis]|uniref:MmgE/PrpD family protein n=1 Tax=Cupriavidus nantongensis TaxID=1796606 RepID=UPI000A7823EF|nr:MmgE/PrpD family protein [Cupriavidus nantongensis]